jgi:hypothetical protein
MVSQRISTTQKVQDSGCQLIRSWQVCFGIERVIHVDFFHHGVAVNAQFYSNVSHNDVHQVIRKKIPGKLSKKIILLHDFACSYTADFMKVT